MTDPQRGLSLGLALPHYDVSFPRGEELTRERLLSVAAWAEEVGLGSLWISDHYFLDISRYGGPAGRRSSYEPLAALAALAGRTAGLRLGTLVLALGFRPAGLLADAARSLAELSGGRFELGLGAGWNEPEYREAGLPFPGAGERLAGLGELTEELRRRLGEERPPIWLGAKGDRALRVVARHADGWNVVWRWSPESYRERLEVFREACRREGRDPGEVRKSVGLVTLMGRDRAELEERFGSWRRSAPPGVLDDTRLDDLAGQGLVGTPERAVELLDDYRRLGVEEVILNFSPLPFGWYPDSGQDLVEEVAGVVRSWTAVH